MAKDAWGNELPDFGTGYKPADVYNRETGWTHETGGGREIGSEGWQGYLRAFNPDELNRFKTYKAQQEAKYNSPYAAAERMTAGASNRLAQLITDPSKIQQTAGYQFAKGQGEEAINRSAAAKGQLGSGNVLAELAKYGQGMASQEYGNQINQLSGLMGQSQQFLLGANAGPYQYGALNPTSQSTFNPYGKASSPTSSSISWA